MTMTMISYSFLCLDIFAAVHIGSGSLAAMLALCNTNVKISPRVQTAPRSGMCYTFRKQDYSKVLQLLKE